AASLRSSAYTSGSSCSAADGSPCSIADRMRVTSDMAFTERLAGPGGTSPPAPGRVRESLTSVGVLPGEPPGLCPAEPIDECTTRPAANPRLFRHAARCWSATADVHGL